MSIDDVKQQTIAVCVTHLYNQNYFNSKSDIARGVFISFLYNQTNSTTRNSFKLVVLFCTLLSVGRYHTRKLVVNFLFRPPASSNPLKFTCSVPSPENNFSYVFERTQRSPTLQWIRNVRLAKYRRKVSCPCALTKHHATKAYGGVDV